MGNIIIQEFFDGYCITHNDIDYKYMGKSSDVVNMISEKVKELLNKDLEKLKEKVLRDNNLL